MPMDYHQQVMQDSVQEFSDLMRQRRKLDKKIARLQKMVRFAAMQLSRSNPPSAPPQPPQGVQKPQPGLIGFTEAVRRVLSTYKMWLSPVLVRDLLPTVGFDTDSYKEPLPSIHVILRRLVSSGEAVQSKRLSGSGVYIWADRPLGQRTRRVSD
jgi:hypothetical protein